MTTEDMQDVLRRLVAWADGWKAAGAVPPIERDLALDKLRQLYEALLAEKAVQHVPVSFPAVDEDEAVPVSINLDEVFSIGAVSEPAGPDLPVWEGWANEKREDAQTEGSAPASSVRSEEELPPPEDETVPVPPAELEREAEPDGTGASATKEVPQAPSQPVFPTLFGLEETDEMRRRRHKQQVLMSLYDDEPHPASRLAKVPEPKSEASSDEPVSRPVGGVDGNAHPSGKEVSETLVHDPLTDLVDSAAEPAENNSPETEEPSVSAEEGRVAIPQSGLPAEALPSAGGENAQTPQTSGSESATGALQEMEMSPLPEKGAVLGEVINHGVQRLADTLAAPRDRSTEAAGCESVADLREAIGLNDKFLLIRDLFDGDAEAYDRAVEALNGCADLDECMIYIAEHYAWNPHSDGAVRMMELLERKFS